MEVPMHPPIASKQFVMKNLSRSHQGLGLKQGIQHQHSPGGARSTAL
jgi:hypothetical protein